MQCLTRLACTGVLSLSLLSASAAAQTGGFQGGISADPDQFYFGVHFESSPLAGGFKVRPSLEVGLGENLRLMTANFEFTYWFTGSTWSLYLGSGPVLVVRRTERPDTTDLAGGYSSVIGLAHRSGLFTEFKIGSSDVPEVKVGAGFTFRFGSSAPPPGPP